MMLCDWNKEFNSFFNAVILFLHQAFILRGKPTATLTLTLGEQKESIEIETREIDLEVVTCY